MPLFRIPFRAAVFFYFCKKYKPLSFSYQSIDLPIRDVIPGIQQALANSNTLIIGAPPGAGKSTLLPLALMDCVFLEGKKILMLEPRRLAAKTISWRMAELLGEKTGETVGYRIRFESMVSNKTKIEVLTEGILAKMLHDDSVLDNVGMVIFDEFHERNIHADLAMALCREIQQVLRPDLRILVMSATLDMPELSKLLDAPVIQSQGRTFPVDVGYAGDIDFELLPEMMAKAIRTVVKESNGDILAFLPGQGEIKKTEAILRKSVPEFSIHPLYGQLSPTAQHHAIFPNKYGRRKVVLATSIAETSLTIEGIGTVIDSGFARISKFNPKTGLSKLETIRVTKDSADQRAGRAGRLGPGRCVRMWSKATDMKLAEFRTPEIQEADLASLVLELARWGINDIKSMTWLTPPPAGHVAQAKELLENIQALENGKLTPHGIAVSQIPAHPRIAHMLEISKDLGEMALSTDIAAILEEKDPLDEQSGVDINLRIEALRRARKEKLSVKSLDKIEKIAKQYRKILDIDEDNRSFDPYVTGLLIANAFPERIASARPGNNAQFQLANGKLAQMGHRDELAHEPWIAVCQVDARDKMGKIFLASPLNPKDLRGMVKERRIVQWDHKAGVLVAQNQLGIGSIVLQSQPIKNTTEEEKSKALLTAIKENGQHMLPFEDDTIQLQHRVGSLRIWNPEQQWPDFATSSLLENAETWLLPYLTGVRTQEQLNKLDLKSFLNNSLEYNQQQTLQDLAPEKIQVPSGSWIGIQYFPHGEPPILSVRLQEVFGWLETPKINRGKVPLLLHLLSPGFKPVQVTSDLRNFWNNTYFEVKKELKNRYPKHYWPENPLDAEAVRGVKKKG
jgi:ATP-dependent helicase HrpB